MQVRAKTFYAEAVGEDMGQVDVPVLVCQSFNPKQ